MPDRYEPQRFEAQWRKRWQEADLFRTREEEGRPKFYALDFFPYPSGAGLSVGHCRNYIPTDVLARMKHMQGYNVLHPMGFDAFGLPAENEAIKRKTHPAPMIDAYAANYKRQMDLVGISYDWSRSFKSSDPSYYKWTQWVFEKLYERGLAYRKLAAVNWDPVDKTVLADEEVIAGRAERSGALVEKKWIPQWFFKITEYAQRLIDDLDLVDWPEGIKQQQRNWIGRSEGVEFEMKLARAPSSSEAGFFPSDEEGVGDWSFPAERTPTFRVFTTRIDTIFGMTFCVLAPEHPLVEWITAHADVEHREAITKYREHAKTMSEASRQDATREKTGVFTGAYAVNPANGKKVPIWIADYVLIGYGTGAIMAVPAGDQRDLEFAKEFGLPVVPIQNPTPEFFKSQGREDTENALAEYLEDPKRFTSAFVDKQQPLINAGEYTGMGFEEAARALGEWIEALGIGERKIQYKLRDWLISRQRYWGCPIPVIHTKDGDEQLVPEDCLPVELPQVEHYEPAGDGSSPLAHIPDFVNVTDRDGRLGRRETDTMGGFACSSWYFLRFCDPHNEDQAWDPTRAAYWMPVDTYVGGAEHAVMHLLYARFWTKVLFDLGLVSVKEPFQRLQNQGQVLAQTPYRLPHEGEKLDVGEEGVLISFEEAKSIPDEQKFYRWARMSKSKGNVVTPDEVVESEGADALRVYELFVAPFEQDVQWSSDGLQGASRFLSRVFRMAQEIQPHFEPSWRAHLGMTELEGGPAKLRRLTHQTIKKATSDIERFAFNTYVAAMMGFLNGVNDYVREMGEPLQEDVLALSEALESFVLLLAPAAPHTADELWESLGKEGFTYLADWPSFREDIAAEDTVTIAVQVNGKLRDTFEAPAGTSKEELEKNALALQKIQPHLEGKTVRKVIVVADKLVNVVVG